MTNELWLHLEDKDFAVMKGPTLVAWFNRAVPLAVEAGLTSFKEVKKFENHEKAVRRCAVLAQAIRANQKKTAEPAPAAPETTEVSQSAAPETSGETDMAKKAKAKKTNGDARKPRVIKKAPGSVADLGTIRAGTDRAIVLGLCNGSRTAEQVSAEAKQKVKSKGKMSPGYVLQHLYSANRDAGVGYEVGENGKISLAFPGSKSLKDIVVAKTE